MFFCEPFLLELNRIANFLHTYAALYVYVVGRTPDFMKGWQDEAYHRAPK